MVPGENVNYFLYRLSWKVNRYLDFGLDCGGSDEYGSTVFVLHRLDVQLPMLTSSEHDVVNLGFGAGGITMSGAFFATSVAGNIDVAELQNGVVWFGGHVVFGTNPLIPVTIEIFAHSVISA